MQNCVNTSNLQQDIQFNVDNQWNTLRLKDEEDQNTEKIEDSSSSSTLPIENKGLRMMQMMGYKSGLGLGKNKQGIINTVEVSTQIGTRGLGLQLENFQKSKETWDFSQENANVFEEVEWLSNAKDSKFTSDEMREWPVHDQRITKIDGQIDFCDEAILKETLDAKNIFDELDLKELCQARARANPFETIRSVFFMNRAALKMANIDAATNFMFTNIDQNIHHENDPPYYFADVCAGPGGFSEYILWRKKWCFKGFGLTLKDENDFKLADSICASPVTFQALYGSEGDGNVCNPQNIEDFRMKILHETGGKGVHFMMSDGGFSVEGNENIQEVLSKNIYLCQCLVALEILRPHGHFVTKMFDLFTNFSVGLLFLMYQCFEKVCILKPNSSRPANSERYFICCNLKSAEIVGRIKNYLQEIANKLWEIKDDPLDIIDIVPLKIIKEDEDFYDYIYRTNNRLAKNQALSLRKLAAFCRNPTLQETRQDELRKSCLKYWDIPDVPKVPLPKLTVEDLLAESFYKKELLLVQPREISKIDQLFQTISSDLKDWYYVPMQCGKLTNMCNFYVAVASCRVFRLQGSKWVRVKNLQLCRGSLLYGELVKEKCLITNLENVKHSLHVIDALRLGDMSLSELKFEERRKLIEIYCRSVNHEFRTINNIMRVRTKIVEPLERLPNLNNICNLPVLGFNTEYEFHNINSILLLKTNQNQSFHSTYVLRAQVFLRDDGISLSEMNDLVKKISKM